MKLAICEWMLPIKGPATFKKIKELGFEGVQLDDWDGYQSNHALCDPYVQELYVNAAQENGLQLLGIAGNGFARDGGMIHDIDTAKGIQGWKTMMATIDACSQMGMPVYLASTFFAGFPRTVKDRKNIVERLKDACDYAADKKVTIALESGFAAPMSLEIYDAVNRPNFGIYYDTQNPLTYSGADIPADIRAIGPGKIKQIHVKDGADCVQGCLPLGQGETRFFEAAEAIRDIGYDDWIVFENCYAKPRFRSEIDDVWERMAADIRTAKKAFRID